MLSEPSSLHRRRPGPPPQPPPVLRRRTGSRTRRVTKWWAPGTRPAPLQRHAYATGQPRNTVTTNDRRPEGLARCRVPKAPTQPAPCAWLGVTPPPALTRTPTCLPCRGHGPRAAPHRWRQGHRPSVSGRWDPPGVRCGPVRRPACLAGSPRTNAAPWNAETPALVAPGEMHCAVRHRSWAPSPLCSRRPSRCRRQWRVSSGPGAPREPWRRILEPPSGIRRHFSVLTTRAKTGAVAERAMAPRHAINGGRSRSSPARQRL